MGETDNIWENIEFAMDKISTNTLSHLLSTSQPYRRQMERAIAMEQCYEKMELTEGQRKIIDSLLQERENVAQKYSNLAWFAGVIDCMTFMRKAETLGEQTN